MLETGFCDQINSFYRCMIMWRAIRFWASLCGEHTLHASILNLQLRWGSQIVHSSENTNNNRMHFKSVRWRASFGQRVAILISGFGCAS
jgi:hypothetical protein